MICDYNIVSGKFHAMGYPLWCASSPCRSPPTHGSCLSWRTGGRSRTWRQQQQQRAGRSCHHRAALPAASPRCTGVECRIRCERGGVGGGWASRQGLVQAWWELFTEQRAACPHVCVHGNIRCLMHVHTHDTHLRGMMMGSHECGHAQPPPLTAMHLL